MMGQVCTFTKCISFQIEIMLYIENLCTLATSRYNDQSERCCIS